MKKVSFQLKMNITTKLIIGFILVLGMTAISASITYSNLSTFIIDEASIEYQGYAAEVSQIAQNTVNWVITLIAINSVIGMFVAFFLARMI